MLKNHVVTVFGGAMYCDLDQAEKPDGPSEDWANHPTYGWVHQLDGWHTVTGSLLDGTPATRLWPRLEPVPNLPLRHHLPALPDDGS